MDTHRDAHVGAVLSVTGAVLGTEEFPATAAGYRELLKWARKSGVVRRAGVEGTGSYGASLSRYLLAQGVDVLDVNRMDRADRRRRGKTDPLDAQNAAREVLSGRARARAKAGDGPVQIPRMYKLPKVSAVKARTQAINQLKAVLVIADPALREELAGLGNAELFRTCAGFADLSSHEEAGEESVLQATRITLGLLAGRIGQLTEQIREVDARLARLVERHAPQLLELWWGSARTAAVALLIAVGDNPERLSSEASFAALCGVSPVERSSGIGSSAGSTAAATGRRMLRCTASCSLACASTPAPKTTTSAGSRRGKTRREIIRCLKRYAAREVFPLVGPPQPEPRS